MPGAHREGRQRWRITCSWQGSSSPLTGTVSCRKPLSSARWDKTEWDCRRQLALKRPEEEGAAAPAEHKQREIPVFLWFLPFCSHYMPMLHVFISQLLASPKYEWSFGGGNKSAETVMEHVDHTKWNHTEITFQLALFSHSYDSFHILLDFCLFKLLEYGCWLL